MRILVTYATWHGSTEGVAQKVADELKAAGAEVDIRPAREVSDVAPYDGVVIGSGIRVGSPHGDVKSLLVKHSGALAQKKTALFIVCLAAADDKDETRAETEKFLKGITEAHKGVAFAQTGAFGGGYDRDRAGCLVRLMFWMMKQKPCDKRDWDAISAWAKKVAVAFGLTGA